MSLRNVYNFLKGKKTYSIAVVGVLLSILQWYGIKVPPYVYVILGSTGLATLRSGVKDDVQNLEGNWSVSGPPQKIVNNDDIHLLSINATKS